MLIDCDGCGVRGVACGDCVVTFLLGPTSRLAGVPDTPADVVSPAGSPIRTAELDPVDRRALRVLADAGLVPALRHERRAG